MMYRRGSWTKVLLLTPLTFLLLWMTSTRYYSSNSEAANALLQKSYITSGPKHAFATFLSGYNGADSEKYFTAVKLLTFQFLRDPPTRAQEGTPFLVLVTQDVEEERREALRQGGATVILVDDVQRDWFSPKNPRWDGVMAKLNLWSLTQYEKIVFVDADTVILKPMDDIFSIPATEIRQSLAPPEDPENDPLADIPVTVPQEYMMAGIHDLWIEAFKKPAENETAFYEMDHYMNAGFFVISPSMEMFDFLLSLIENPVPFDLNYPEQNLLNFAYRTDGQMPWQDLGRKWNDLTQLNPWYERNASSLHHKWWVEVEDERIDHFIDGAVRRLIETEHGFTL